MKLFRNIVIVLIIVVCTTLVGAWAYYQYNLTSVSDSEEEIVFSIEKGETVADIAHNLKESGLIKGELFFRYYLKFKKINNLRAATYELSPNMKLDTIIDNLVQGDNANPNAFMITFKEGLNMRAIAKVIAENTNNEEEAVFDLLKNETYIDSLINQYWFLTADIKNSSIYYPLEGYLYPDTYQVKDKDVSVGTIFELMLKEMDKALSQYKDQINNGKYTVHELLTLASMVELEGTNADNRKTIAGVFYNRLDKDWSLGSDVTTYYAFKIDMSSSRDLSNKELNTYNPYNTRGPQMTGKLPVGPIANIGKESINAALNPNNSDYYYFVADKNGVIYFSKTEEEHEKNILAITNSGNWIF